MLKQLTSVTDLVTQMTLPEKIGQMAQIEKNSVTAEQVQEYALGSVLSGGGGYPTPNTAEAWEQMVRAYQEAALQSRLGIPILYGVDAVHGHNNLQGATLYPHNIGLGASADEALIEEIGRQTAVTLLANNIHWNFAPAVSVPYDIRWGRTYEGFSQDTELVSRLGAAYVRGLQSEGVLASVKHFVGDGGTKWGTISHYNWINDNIWRGEGGKWNLDQGVTVVDEETLRAVHLPPYKAAIEAGAMNIMVSYSSWGGHKMHANKYLLTDVLKGELGFEGFLVSDWLAIDQISEDYEQAVIASINAGLDMIMVPFDYPRFLQAMTKAIDSGAIAMSRIDDAVTRILRTKKQIGLWQRPLPADSIPLSQIGSIETRQLAQKAVQQTAVLLTHDGDTLPLTNKEEPILLAGDGADDIGLQCGGWSIEWQGKRGAITDGSTMYQTLQAQGANVLYKADGAFEPEQKARIGIVVLAEEPYAEGEGDRADLDLSAEEIELVKNMSARCEKLVVVLYAGRPLFIKPILDQATAIVCAWLPGTEGAGVADLLLGNAPFTGKSAYNWPTDLSQLPLNGKNEPLFPIGHGLTT